MVGSSTRSPEEVGVDALRSRPPRGVWTRLITSDPTETIAE
jgi:hypothetical protein